MSEHSNMLQKDIMYIAKEYKQIAYDSHDNYKKHHTNNPYQISLITAMKFVRIDITCITCQEFIKFRDDYLLNPLYNFRYAKNDMDLTGHYIYQPNLDGIETLYFTIKGFKYFSLLYPSPINSIISLYYIELESQFLKFTRDAEGFLK
jgi:hypothetical protein